jgi:DNA-binding IclR family transcriptional regulator
MRPTKAAILSIYCSSNGHAVLIAAPAPVRFSHASSRLSFHHRTPWTIKRCFELAAWRNRNKPPALLCQLETEDERREAQEIEH